MTTPSEIETARYEWTSAHAEYRRLVEEQNNARHAMYTAGEALGALLLEEQGIVPGVTIVNIQPYGREHRNYNAVVYPAADGECFSAKVLTKYDVVHQGHGSITFKHHNQPLKKVGRELKS